MDLLSRLRDQAKRDIRTIVLPEGDSDRILEAAQQAACEGIARIILLGREDDIRHRVSKELISSADIRIVDCRAPENLGGYLEDYRDLHGSRRADPGEVESIFKNNFSFPAAMMVRNGDADGFVAGAECPSKDVIRAVIRCFEREEDISAISGCFVVIVPECSYGENGVFIFADCAVIPDPTERQLADIAVSSARLCKQLMELEPRIAMLSFSTKGSASSERTGKIRKAVKLVKEREPWLIIDGEIQLDSAIVPKVARMKNPGSVIEGDANVLIFPGLEAANIGYKLVQALAKARTVGPLIQGTVQPSSDLSRGCSVEDIIDAIAVTAVRAQKNCELHSITPFVTRLSEKAIDKA